MSNVPITTLNYAVNASTKQLQNLQVKSKILGPVGVSTNWQLAKFPGPFNSVDMHLDLHSRVASINFAGDDWSILLGSIVPSPTNSNTMTSFQCPASQYVVDMTADELHMDSFYNLKLTCAVPPPPAVQPSPPPIVKQPQLQQPPPPTIVQQPPDPTSSQYLQTTSPSSLQDPRGPLLGAVTVAVIVFIFAYFFLM